MADPHASSEALSDRVRVLLPLPLDTAYDYRLEASLGAGPGSFVVVPLGGRLTVGVIWDEDAADAAAVPESRLKEVAELLPAPPMAAVTQRFIDWVASYTCAPRGAVLRMAMSVPAALAAPKPRLAYRLAGPPPSRMTSARARIVALLGDGMARTAADLREAAGVGSSVIAGLVAAGTLEEVMLSGHAPQAGPDWHRPGPALTGEQRAAAESLRGRIGQDGFSVTLLDGVTGAGKTEVYFEAIAAALEKGRQVLVLLPEIALTGQWLARFEDRFGAPPLAWHSDLKQTQRRHHWRAVAEGRALVVVGARSALFLPFTDLGLIVVDEEHDGAFKQEEGVIYHARDMAVVRALLGEIPAVLVSATPSLESLVNAQNGRYHLLHLPSRAGDAALPEILAVDMRANPPPRGQWLSPALTEAITGALAAGEQALLFLNRRGYAPLTLCRACGHRLECSNCSAWLVEHRFAGRLQCHHCGYAMRLPPHCPNCDAEASFAACGPGVERLLEEVGALFPEARALVVASDTIHGPNAAAELIRRIAEHEVDLVIGTQIIAKGHHFPLLTCVGVVDADLGLSGGDLRGTERTYQLLSQVAGRAGRAERPGRALLQTYMPEHPVMQALISGDRDAFLAREADARRQQGMPPFGRLVAVIVSGPDEAVVSEVARALGRAAPRGPDVQVLGPAPAPLSLLRGRFRQRLLMKTPRTLNASELARRWVGQIKAPNAVRIQIDVDPYSFL